VVRMAIAWLEELLEEPLQIQDGLARVPDRPGIGLTWRSEALKALSLDR
jgi:L-alanine-DL-glutamate epimerase-like enolase superfamily enzyme